MLIPAENDRRIAELAFAMASDAEQYAKTTSLLEDRLAETQARMSSGSEEIKALMIERTCEGQQEKERNFVIANELRELQAEHE